MVDTKKGTKGMKEARVESIADERVHAVPKARGRAKAGRTDRG